MKVLKLFGHILSDMILFVSSKQRDLEARNFAVFICFQHMKTTALQHNQVGVLQMAFQAQKVFETFEKWAPVLIKMVSTL